MADKIAASELEERVLEFIGAMDRKDFLTLMNDILGTEYKVEDIDWEE